MIEFKLWLLALLERLAAYTYGRIVTSISKARTKYDAKITAGNIAQNDAVKAAQAAHNRAVQVASDNNALVRANADKAINKLNQQSLKLSGA